MQLRRLRVLARAFVARDIAEPTSGPAAGAAPVLPASAPLFEVIHVLRGHERGLVRGTDGALGVIAREELQNLPGRTWLFGMVAFIELYLALRIEQILHLYVPGV